MSNSPFYTKTETDYKVQEARTRAYLGIATTTTTPPATGAYWYRVQETGTYTNFLEGGSPIVVTEGDFNDGKGNYYDVFLEVKENMATKILSLKTPVDYNNLVLNPTSTNKAETGKSIDNYLFESSENLANPENLKYGYYISYGDGLEYTNDDFSILSNYVLGNKTYYIKKTGESQSLAYYDINGNFIIGVATYGASFTTPANAFFVKINVKKEQISTFMLSEKDVPFSPYFKNFKFQNKNYLENLNKKSIENYLFDNSKNLANPENLKYGYYISYGDGLEYQNPQFAILKQEILGGKTYYIKKTGEPESLAYYDINGNFISGVATYGASFTTPANAFFVKINVKKEQVSTFMLSETDIPFTPYFKDLKLRNKNYLENLNKKTIDNYLFTSSENLANPKNFKYGYYVSYGDGLEYANLDFTIFNLDVQPSKIYYIKNSAESIAFYDINGTFVSAIESHGTSFTTPSNARMAKINVKAEGVGTFMISENNAPFTPFSKVFKFENKKYSENLYKKSMIVAYDSYVSYGDGKIYPLAHHHVAKIPVQVGKTYTVINNAEPQQSALMSPTNDPLLGFEKIPKKITIPSGVSYILITLVGMQEYNFFGFYEGEVEGVQDSQNKNLSSGIKVLNTYYTVDKKSGDFKTISDAVKNLNDGATILINGMFEESVSLLSRKLHLVGVNKFTCGIVTNDGDYNKPPVNMSAGSTLKNLTILADNGSPNFTTPAYAIHHDWDNGGGESIIDDCILISKFNASIGIGAHNNQQITIRNSKLYNLNPNQPYDYGGIYFHNKKASGATRQMLTLENCVIENADGAAIIIHDANHRADGAFDDARDTLVRLTHNVFYSKKYGVGAGIVGGDTPLDSASKWGYIKLHKANFGNNISELNH